MKVIELYSGIGGMHYALKGSIVGNQAEVVFAADVNPICNKVYKHNFQGTNLQNRNMISLTAEEINQLAADVILMSPPCQPFTRLGKQRDVQDNRNSSFLHFIELIPNLTTVRYILMENVKGFDVSETRSKLLTALQKSKFKYEEYLLNPMQFGICNSRLRYYLLAKKCIKGSNTNLIIEELPLDSKKIIDEIASERKNAEVISNVLEYLPGCEEWTTNLISIEVLNKYFMVMDIVGHDSRRSCCFTRGYTRLFEGTGSIIADMSSNELDDYVQKLKQTSDDDGVREKLLRSLKLRHFTPKEITRLMCFPETFSFPEHITMKQQYKLISNSINVYVVSFLISYLINDAKLK